MSLHCSPFVAHNSWLWRGASVGSVANLDQGVNGIKLSSNTRLINGMRTARDEQVAVSRIGSAFDGVG
jgi:hypothetical protein